MDQEVLSYFPTLDRAEIVARLRHLLVTGRIEDEDLTRRIQRLDERFHVYTSCFPLGMWGSGLIITQEMRVLTEAYLPLSEIRAAFHRLFSRSSKYYNFFPASAIETSASWLDVLHHLQPLVQATNPALLLRRLMADGDLRTLFLFKLFLPRQFGGSFGRYSAQTGFLCDWLTKAGRGGHIRCLDAACGSGEGSYELALLLLKVGYTPENLEVHGVTLAPLEVFTAAHAWFPHDPERERGFRRRIGRIWAEDVRGSLVFRQEDLTDERCCSADQYHVVMCNGLLGGPLLNEREKLKRTVSGLCARVKPGGILLAADRFHNGWKRTTPDEVIGEMLVSNGLKVLQVPEGVAGVKQ